LGKALEQDSKGQTLPRFRYSGTVPAGSFFMVGANPRSFDSKYFGFIHVDEILYKALPLW
jgi:type IV secretory pathway protease TraF